MYELTWRYHSNGKVHVKRFKTKEKANEVAKDLWNEGACHIDIYRTGGLNV
jgi:hypothetical protein